MAEAPRSAADVVVCAPTTVPYERFSEHDAPHWFGRALRTLCDETGLDPLDFDGAALTSMTLAPDSAVSVVEHLGLRLRWLDQVTVGGASGVVALRRAVSAVRAGDAELVVCAGADTNRRGGFDSLTENFSQFSRDAVYPYGGGGPNGSFALITDAFMRGTGVSAADFGVICAAQRMNASENPNALMRKPYTLEEYLESRLIADPIRLLDCVMPCAGAEAFIVTTRERARALGLRCAAVLGSFESYNDFPDDPVQSRGGWSVHAPAMWQRAGVEPADVDVVQTYDDYPVMVVMQLRDLGFAPADDLSGFIQSNTFTADGSFPHNTSGGQLSTGQPGFAGGFLGINETLRQLTGRPLGRAVQGARTGLVSGFGMINYDRGLVSAAAVLGGAE